MKKEVFALFFLMFLISFVFAYPPEPMAFYGNVTMNGTLIPNGYYLNAKIGGTVSGQCEVIDGVYGKGSNSCIVQSYSSEDVDFYLGDNLLGSHSFQSKEIVNLNFETDSLPSNFVPLSNGVCEPEKGECSYNLLDCGNSVTTVCVGNGVCDSKIGETCSNNPSECGACPVTSTDSGGSGGGGGGSSGGGSSGGGGSLTPISLASNNGSGEVCVEKWECSNWSNSIGECGTRSCEDINNCGTELLKPETDILCETNKGFFTSIFSFLTGAAVGTKSFSLETSGGRIVLIVLILLIAGGAYFFIKRETLNKKIKDGIGKLRAK